MKKFLLLMTMLCMGLVQTDAKVKLHTIGDSTMQTYDESTDKRGWAQMLQQFFDADQIQVNNRGKSGSSSKSFYSESAYWPTMVAATPSSTTISEGDYVVIQFAHNDEKNQGMDGDSVKAYYNSIGDATSAGSTDYRGTTASGTFKQYIRKFIDETKARGAHPVIVTPICRKYFQGTSTIRRNGQHDLGDNFSVLTSTGIQTGQSVPASDHSQDYVQSLIDVAAEYEDVPVVDLTTLTAQMYVSYGEGYCTANLFCKDDSTHPQGLGATLIARAFAQAVKNGENSITRATNYVEANKAKSDAVLAALAEGVIVSNEITFNPTTGDMGQAYNGQQLVKEFNISAFGLPQESGNITLTTDGIFELSADKNEWSQQLTLAYTGSTLIAKVYVGATLTGAGIVTGHLTASDGVNSRTLELTAEVINLDDSSVECSVVWPMNGNGDYVVDGPIQANDQTWSEMYARDYNNVNKAAVWPEESGYDYSRKTQRNCTLEDAWPANEIDEVSTRYIQFSVQCPADMKLNMDRISLYVAGAGGSGMRCKIYYSLDSLFSAPTQIAEFASMAGNTAYLVSHDLVETITDGQQLYLRIYPWYNGGAANAKTICLADVTFHGYATAAGTGIEQVRQAEASLQPCYDLLGRRLGSAAGFSVQGGRVRYVL